MFEHSVKVPRLYKSASKILQEVKEKGSSLKELLYQTKHSNIKGIYALVAETIQHFSVIESLIQKSELLIKEPRFDPWLARILITELLWTKKQLAGNSKPVKTILLYRNILEECKQITDFEGDQETVKKVKKPRCVRINTLAITLEEAINGFRGEGWTLVRFTNGNYDEFVSKAASLGLHEFMIDLHVKELLLFPSNTEFYKHAAYRMGSIILQDKASCLPAHLLNPVPGSIVLDMCAAPGMKTTQLAALLNNQGTIYAVEKNVRRFNTLNEMVQKTGATCIKTINKDVLEVTSKECPNVGYILVDPSCSGSGMTERVTVDGKYEQPYPERLKNLSGFQVLVLKHALTNFPETKRVVYSTCSVYPQENEFVVNEVLKNNNKFKLVSAKGLLSGPWKNCLSERSDATSDFCLHTKPEEDLSDGFFIAVFERNEDQSENKCDPNSAKPKKKKKQQDYEPSISADNQEKHKHVSKGKEKKNKTASEVSEKCLTAHTNDVLVPKNKNKGKKNKHVEREENEEPVKFSAVTDVQRKCKKRKHVETEGNEEVPTKFDVVTDIQRKCKKKKHDKTLSCLDESKKDVDTKNLEDTQRKHKKTKCGNMRIENDSEGTAVKKIKTGVYENNDIVANVASEKQKKSKKRNVKRSHVTEEREMYVDEENTNTKLKELSYTSDEQKKSKRKKHHKRLNSLGKNVSEGGVAGIVDQINRTDQNSTEFASVMSKKCKKKKCGRSSEIIKNCADTI